MKIRYYKNLLSPVFILALFLFISCDPGYYVVIKNRTDYPKEIQIYSSRKSVSIFDDLELKKIDWAKDSLIYIDTLSYTTVTIPSLSTLWLESALGGPPDKRNNIVIENDTIYNYLFPAKQAWMLRKYIYTIEE